MLITLSLSASLACAPSPNIYGYLAVRYGAQRVWIARDGDAVAERWENKDSRWALVATIAGISCVVAEGFSA